MTIRMKGRMKSRMRRAIYIAVGLTAVAGALACSGTSVSGGPTPVPTVAPVVGAAGVSRAPASAATTGGGAGTGTPLQRGADFGAFLGGADPANVLTGTIASASETSVTINTQRGPLRVAVDSNTRITRTEDGTAGDLKIGDSVRVAGQRDGTGAIDTQAITVSEEPFPAVTFARRGDGSSATGTRLRLDQSGQTAPLPRGEISPEQIGQIVEQAVASGRVSQEQAAQLRERLASGSATGGGFVRAGGPPGGGFISGRISDLGPGTMTIDTEAGQVSVTLTQSTRVQRIESPPPAELVAGTTVSVAAERGTDGVVRATAIVVGDAGAGGLQFRPAPTQRP